MADYKVIHPLGKGAYGEVVLAQKIDTGHMVAIKKVDKNFMKREKKEYQVFIEKGVMRELKHPGIVKLFATFHNPNTIFFVIEYMSGGEFSDFINLHESKIPSLCFSL